MIESNFLPLNLDAGPFRYTSGITLSIRQLSVNEPIAGGNKLYKLKYSILKAKALGKTKIVTFGGAFSNHIAATARAGKLEGFETFGIIRGEKEASLNVTLSRAASEGMKFIFVNRTDYRKKSEANFLRNLIPDIDNYYIIPEGGANEEGVKGCTEILNEDDAAFDYIVLSCGTGTTAAGILLSMKPHQKLIGFSVLRDNGFMEKEIQKWVNLFQPKQNLPQWKINHDFHFGGYAKSNLELDLYCQNFQQKTGVAIEPIYTGKMFYGLQKLIDQGYFKSSSHILALHTGGMQYLI